MKIMYAKDPEYNRRILEQGQFQVLVAPEAHERKDTTRQLDTGLNHILAKIAHTKGIAIGVDSEELRRLPKKEKAQRIARIIQNIRLCRKANVNLATRGKKEIRYALLSWGASTAQCKEAQYF